MLKHQFAIAPLSILIFLTSSCLVAGQVRKPGQCRTDIKHLKSADVKSYHGIWHVHNGNFHNLDETYQKKTSFLFGPNDYSIFFTNFVGADGYYIPHGILQSGPEGAFRVKDDVGASSSDFRTIRIDLKKFEYKVLGPECANYLIIYGCQDLPSGSYHAEFIAIYTRDRRPPKSVTDAYKAALEAQRIATDLLR
ncbi:uncharacterized protein [Eurosta solidaginis]|uniref:uncharacterized protein n=1 Tax=Eurosta solidaginis TaxID=178769 RepID=UPI0035305C48